MLFKKMKIATYTFFVIVFVNQIKLVKLTNLNR